MQQSIHGEISKQLKSIDRIRQMPKEYGDADQAALHKQKISELLMILTKLKELLNHVQYESIDEFVDLLLHKFNAILNESNVNNLLASIEHPIYGYSSRRQEGNSAQTEHFTTIYLNDILKRCNEMIGKKSPNAIDDNHDVATGAGTMTTESIVINTIMNFVWPEIFQRLDNYQRQRKQINVDLKRLTSEEEAMVESIGHDCVEDIMEHLFNRSQ